ncbi:HdeD family acid-resistance protein [Rickettsiales endosymbiont of Stachyamoeba lipophora]|uniref:HdeD family acid-resistance protein n=1 Tax=Rickettsiales endosymbiont of Stachyamoeba lipophora TaxID=2486578 RepID=UPI000F650E77|nr:DUF308 domain-containing protein [Rickettsiales endosymbiont of Stachyamoeba lipophora]AZL15914.1 HdeD family acid-resistance protein [Rickettsiales endosymbiont of Stachyamoeba lipophora]
MKKNLKHGTPQSNLCSLAPNWWVFALRGIISIIFGGIAIYMPITTIVVMTIIFGIYTIMDGIFSLISGINRASKGHHWGGLVLSGVLGIIAGLTMLVKPQISSIGLMAFLWTTLSIWSISTGISEIAAAVRLRQEIQGEWLLGLSGALSIIVGISVLILLWLNPMASLITLGLFIGSNACISGIVLLLLAFKLFNLERTPTPTWR